jgi:hypothetical protein
VWGISRSLCLIDHRAVSQKPGGWAFRGPRSLSIKTYAAHGSGVGISAGRTRAYLKSDPLQDQLSRPWVGHTATCLKGGAFRTHYPFSILIHRPLQARLAYLHGGGLAVTIPSRIKIITGRALPTSRVGHFVVTIPYPTSRSGRVRSD